jgi:hypothetical protein
VPALFALFIAITATAHGADKVPAAPRGPQTFTHRVAGLFQPDRADDLKRAMDAHPTAKLLAVDYDHGRATFSYDPKIVSTESLNQFLAKAAFGILPPQDAPPDKLTTVEIDIVGLDCKGCALGAYWCVYKLEGVDHATASFHTGKLIAAIDPTKTNRAALEDALKKKQVTLKSPAPAKPAK